MPQFPVKVKTGATTQRTSMPDVDTHALCASTAAALAALLREGTPESTVRALEHAFRYWSAWYRLRFDAPFPLPSSPVETVAVLQFIADHVPRTEGEALVVEMPPAIEDALIRAGVKAQSGVLSFNTVKQRLALLSSMHRKLRFVSPMTDPRVVELLGAAETAAHHQGRGARPKPPLPEATLMAVIEACDSSPAGLRDRALMSVLYHSGGRRRSELAYLAIADCARSDLGYVLTFRRVKRKKDPLKVPLVGSGAQALDAWLVHLAEIGRTEGPVFIDVRGTGKTHYGAVGLSGHAVGRLIARRLDAAGVHGGYSAHSFRSGFATDRLDRGESYAQVMTMTGHSDPATLAKFYHRPLDVLTNPAARPSAESEPSLE